LCGGQKRGADGQKTGGGVEKHVVVVLTRITCFGEKLGRGERGGKAWQCLLEPKTVVGCNGGGGRLNKHYYSKIKRKKKITTGRSSRRSCISSPCGDSNGSSNSESGGGIDSDGNGIK
jgi:hypothetical protein